MQIRSLFSGCWFTLALWPAAASPVALTSLVRGLPADADGTVAYSVMVSNATEQAQAVDLAVERIAWAAMDASVEPVHLELAAQSATQVTVTVTVPARVPPGGARTADACGRASRPGEPPSEDGSAGRVALPEARLKFITARRMEHPYIQFRQDGWDAIRKKSETVDWAKALRADVIARAERWNVPNVQKPNDPKPGEWLFVTQTEVDLLAASQAYQLTREAKYAEKVRTFLLRLSDPTNGFPVTRRACHQGCRCRRGTTSRTSSCPTMP
jgi:hypothetical protein